MCALVGGSPYFYNIDELTYKTVFRRLIGEAETKRKPLIRNLYTAGRRTRKNKIGKNSHISRR